MSQPIKQDNEAMEHVKRALKIADDLATAVLRGGQGAQRLALDYARAVDDAKRAGFDLTKNA